MGFEAVARASGLGSTANLRASVRAHTGVGPARYRERFGPRPPAMEGGRSPGRA
jgi:AraC family transcriptional regulator, transcriptional activator FtrA